MALILVFLGIVKEAAAAQSKLAIPQVRFDRFIPKSIGPIAQEIKKLSANDSEHVHTDTILQTLRRSLAPTMPTTTFRCPPALGPRCLPSL